MALFAVFSFLSSSVFNVAGTIALPVSSPAAASAALASWIVPLATVVAAGMDAPSAANFASITGLG